MNSRNYQFCIRTLKSTKNPDDVTFFIYSETNIKMQFVTRFATSVLWKLTCNLDILLSTIAILIVFQIIAPRIRKVG